MENEIDIIDYKNNIQKDSDYYKTKLYNVGNKNITELELDCKIKDMEFLEEKLEKTMLLKEEYFDSSFFWK